MAINAIQAEVLRQFRQLGIRHLVVGGQAMRAYGIDRSTHDLDLLVARDLANAQALTRFMQRVQNMPPLERLQQPNFKFTVGDPGAPDVDILTSVAGNPSFDDLFGRRQRLRVDGHDLDVVAPEDLVAIKDAAAEKNEADLACGTLSDAENRIAEGAARKERWDSASVRMWIGSRN